MHDDDAGSEASFCSADGGDVNLSVEDGYVTREGAVTNEDANLIFEDASVAREGAGAIKAADLIFEDAAVPEIDLYVSLTRLLVREGAALDSPAISELLRGVTFQIEEWAGRRARIDKDGLIGWISSKTSEGQELIEKARLDGMWTNRQGEEFRISGDEITWKDGSNSQLSSSGVGKYSLGTDNAQRCDDKLIWTDGDVWSLVRGNKDTIDSMSTAEMQRIAAAGSSKGGGGLRFSDVDSVLRGLGDPQLEETSIPLSLLSPDEENTMVDKMRQNLLTKCGSPLPSDSFLLLCLRVWRYQDADALRVAQNFVMFRRAASWPFEIPARQVCPALLTGMHWLLPERDTDGRRVLVYNPRYLDTKVCSIADFQLMGCYIMQEAMEEIETVDRGITIVVDLQGLDPFSLLTSFGIGDVHRGVTMWRDAYPCKLKKIFIVNINVIVKKLVEAGLRALSAKLRRRIVCVDASMKQLHASISPTSLPASLGGTGATGWEEWCAQRLDVAKCDDFTLKT